jgi:hypothetical protein
MDKTFRFLLFLMGTVFLSGKICAQSTLIKGFVDVNTIYQNQKLSFNLGEQDLFITSELNDRFSFLGESVFKFSLGSPTTFDVSIERIVMKYNFSGNHNLLLGKHHTPINYWNDTYHHGRVFFPTIGRPLLFDDGFIPLHTTGLDVQGHDLGDIKLGYDFLVGNGIGSTDFEDNDKHKSVTAAVHIKPVENLRIGASYYNDYISKGAKAHDGHQINWNVSQQLATGSIAYFGKKFEFLSEGTFAFDKSDTTGTQNSFAGYLYSGVKLTERVIPYIRFDYIHYGDGEIFFMKDNAKSFIGGIRYNINYLAVVKLEYQIQDRTSNGTTDKLTAQVAIGF